MTEEKSFVDLVLERMDTNPDEFIEGTQKFRWDSLTHTLRASGIGPQNHSLSVSTYNNNVLWALDEDEVKALGAKYREVYREFLRREFVKNIMDEPNTLNPRSSPSVYVGQGNLPSAYIGQGNLATKGIQKSAKLITTSDMREQAEKVLQTAIDREAREGNWGAVPSGNGST
jgi:hypothetical protein